MSLSLPAAPGPWADDDTSVGAELGLIRWAAQTAGTLADQLTRLAADVGAAAQAIAGRADLARFTEHLERERDGPDGPVAALAASYLHLLGRLAEVDGSPAQIAQAVAEAIAFYDDAREPARRYFAGAGVPGTDIGGEPR